MTLPCPHYAPVSGSHFSQLLITRQRRVLPLPTSCQPFPPSLTSRAPQPLHLESARLCVLQSSSIVLSCLRPASVSSFSVLPIPPSRPLHTWTLPRLNGISPDRTVPTAGSTRSFVDYDSFGHIRSPSSAGRATLSFTDPPMPVYKTTRCPLQV
jgi:hypothetical protein